MPKRCVKLGQIWRLCLACLCFAHPAMANGSLFASNGSLIQARHSNIATDQGVASLFLKTPNTGLFAARKSSTAQAGLHLRAKPQQLAQLRKLIETAESRHDGYDAVQHGARIKPAKLPTRMTISEIFAWIDATPAQPHAIGRYQFIPDTLRRLVDRLGLPQDTHFSPAIQDRLADILLAEAGLNELQKGQATREDFMHNLSKIWAGLPSSNGKSYYHGYAGNKANMTWATFRREMGRIFPG